MCLELTSKIWSRNIFGSFNDIGRLKLCKWLLSSRESMQRVEMLKPKCRMKREQQSLRENPLKLVVEESKIPGKMDHFVKMHCSKESFINEFPVGPGSLPNPIRVRAYRIDKLKQYKCYIFLSI